MVTSSQVPPCPGGTLYVIRPGDTLYRISRSRGIPLDDLVDANPGIDPARLEVGQQICIPGEAPEPGDPSCPGGQLYRIQSGDTFYRLSRRFNVSLDDLVAANPNVDPNALQVGQVVCIPGVAPEPPEECPGIEYTIRSGDTLYVLARRYNTTVDAILQYNPGIDPERLRVGQVICIPTEEEPEPPVTGKRCLVLNPGTDTPDADAVVLLDYNDNSVLGVLDDVPAPEEVNDATQYVLWVRATDGSYISEPMTPVDGVYVGRIETTAALTGYSAVSITAEGEEVGTAPAGPVVASGGITAQS